MNAVVERAPSHSQLPALSDATALIQAIERAALNPQVDIEKMERLFAMQKEIMARQAETEFNAAMAAAQSEIPTIKGNKKNTQTGSFYADLVAVCDVAMPIITKHGFSLSFSQGDCPIEGRIRVICQCAHARGHSRHYHWDAPIDTVGIKGVQNKTQIHGEASSFSYAQRYLTKLAFNLRIEGEDNDGNKAGGGPVLITEKQAADLNAKISEVGANKAAFLKFLKVEKLSDLEAKRYTAALQALEDKARGNR
jgi:hypothetical protein